MKSLKQLARLRILTPRQGYLSHRRWAHEEAPGENFKSFNKKDFDAQQYGGFKSIDRLFAAPETKGVVGRWDWHLWNFLLALIPPGMVILLAKWARTDMQAKQQAKMEKARAEMMQTALAMQRLQELNEGGDMEEAAARDESIELKQRLAELEKTVQTLVYRQSDHRPEASSSAASQMPDSQNQAAHNDSNSAHSPPPASPAAKPKPLVAANTSSANAPPSASPPLPKLPDNPLDRWLPETDCQFCNDTRQRLWGAFKSATGYHSAYGKVQAESAELPFERGHVDQQDVHAVPTAGLDHSAEVGHAQALVSRLDEPPAAEHQQPGPSKQGHTDGNEGRGSPCVSEAPAASVKRTRMGELATSYDVVASTQSVAAEVLSERSLGAQGKASPPTQQQQQQQQSGARLVAASPPVLPYDHPPSDDMSTTQRTSKAASAGLESANGALPSYSTIGESQGGGTPADKPDPLPKIPDNPLDRWLPETDCQFCNDTRQKLWGAFKSSTGYSKPSAKGEGKVDASGMDTK